MFFSVCVSKFYLRIFVYEPFFDIPFTLFLMLVIKSELYDVIPCTSLGIVPVHYTFMYMDEREQQIGENTDIVDFSL